MPKQPVEIPARTLRSDHQKPKFTGRHLILLNRDIKTATINNQARRASLRLAHSFDFSRTKPLDMLEQAFAQADGIVLDNIRVAVLNEGKIDGIEKLRSDRAISRTFPIIEPERFVYALQSGKRKRQAVSYRDNKDASWAMHAINVLNSRFTGKGVNVAVLDTGIDTAHPDLKKQVKRKRSFISGQQVTDLHGHGTHCAGLVAGSTHQARKFRYGTAPGTNLFIGKVLSNEGVGTDSAILSGIDWALENKCRIISLSLGGETESEESYSQVYETIAAEAIQSNCLIMAAAGNESERSNGLVSPVSHPANCPSIMAVGALGPDLAVADFSSGGLNPAGGQVDIAAPGVNIWSTWKKNGYRRESGTSMATPIVAGIAAMLIESNPAATAAGTWMHLVQQAMRLNLPASDIGAGLAYCR